MTQQLSEQRTALVDGGAAERPPTDRMSVGVVGMGYVGLPTAIALAGAGARVLGVDIDLGRLGAIGELRVDLPAHETLLLQDVLATQALTLTDDIGLLSSMDGVIICVPTPVDEHLTPDLAALARACAAVVEVARTGQTIILTSTSYVGTTKDLLVDPLRARGLAAGNDVFVAFSPERIDPGNIAFAHDDVPRVVGGMTAQCAQRAAVLLALTTKQVHVVSTPETAELTKLYENTFRAVNIALVNEIADISSELSVQVTEVIDAAATKPYGFMPFAPGPGVGGHCIPCDPYYLLWQLRARRLTMPLVESAMRGIASRPAHMVHRVRELLAENGVSVHGAHVVVVGVSYKPGVEDVRESPALEILSRLRQLGVEVSFVDPIVDSVRLDGQTLFAQTPADLMLTGSLDLAVLHTRHPQANLRWLDSVPLVLDGTYRAFDLAHRVAV